MVNKDAPYRATFRYGENAESPRREGDVAFSTVHDTWASLYAELEAGKRRKDIGKIEWAGPEHYGTIIRFDPNPMRPLRE